jgi:hypothetical protein
LLDCTAVVMAFDPSIAILPRRGTIQIDGRQILPLFLVAPKN